MIPATAVLDLRILPLADLAVYEYQPRYPERVLHYVRLMEAQPTAHAGVVSVQRRGDRYELLDGHHRYCAAILTGRRELLCLVITEDCHAP